MRTSFSPPRTDQPLPSALPSHEPLIDLTFSAGMPPQGATSPFRTRDVAYRPWLRRSVSELNHESRGRFLIENTGALLPIDLHRVLDELIFELRRIVLRHDDVSHQRNRLRRLDTVEEVVHLHHTQRAFIPVTAS